MRPSRLKRTLSRKSGRKSFAGWVSTAFLSSVRRARCSPVHLGCMKSARKMSKNRGYLLLPLGFDAVSVLGSPDRCTARNFRCRKSEPHWVSTLFLSPRTKIASIAIYYINYKGLCRQGCSKRCIAVSAAQSRQASGERLPPPARRTLTRRAPGFATLSNEPHNRTAGQIDNLRARDAKCTGRMCGRGHSTVPRWST
jgi:hypothetical protein